MQMEQLTAGHGSLTAVRAGSGPDLVVLHSLLADRHAFDPVLPALAATASRLADQPAGLSRLAAVACWR